MTTFNVNQDDHLLTMTLDLKMMPDLGETEEGTSNSRKQRMMVGVKYGDRL